MKDQKKKSNFNGTFSSTDLDRMRQLDKYLLQPLLEEHNLNLDRGVDLCDSASDPSAFKSLHATMSKLLHICEGTSCNIGIHPINDQTMRIRQPTMNLSSACFIYGATKELHVNKLSCRDFEAFIY